MFYNTTDLTGVELQNAHKHTDTQEARAATFFFYAGCNKRFTRDLALHHIFGSNIPISSIHRVLNVLTLDGLIIKSEAAKNVGSFGAKQHDWGLAYYLPSWFQILTTQGNKYTNIAGVEILDPYTIKFTPEGHQDCVTIHKASIVEIGNLSRISRLDWRVQQEREAQQKRNTHEN